MLLFVQFLPHINSVFAQLQFNTLLNSGGVASDFSVELHRVSDGYLLAATTVNSQKSDTFNYSRQFLSIFKTDLAGRQLWCKKYYIPKFGMGARLITPISDSTFLLTGRIIDYVAYHDSSFSWDVFLIVINQHGDTLRSKRVSLSNDYDVANSCIKTIDGGFAIMGQACKGNDCDFFLVKLDSILNVEFKGTFSYSNSSFEQPRDIIQMPDSTYYMFGNTQEQPSLERGHLIKLDPHFNVIWQKTYGTDNNRRLGLSLIRLDDTLLLNYVYATQAAFSGNVMLVKIDTTGHVLSTKTFGSVLDDEFRSMYKLKNGNVVGVGTIDQVIGTSRQASAWLVKLNPAGDTLWSRIYDYRNTPKLAKRSTYFLNVWEEDNGDILLLGTAFGIDSTDQEEGQDIWLMRLDSSGCLYGNCIFPTGIENIPTEDLVMYPNPASDKLFIKSFHRIEKVIICNLIGQELVQISPEENTINISMLQTGVYLFYVHTNKGIAVRKIVVQ